MLKGLLYKILRFLNEVFVIKTVVQNDRHVAQCNTIELPEFDLHVCSQLTFNKVAKVIDKERIIFPISRGTAEYSYGKK